MIKTILSLGFGILLSSSAANAEDVALMMPATTIGGPNQYSLYIGTASDVEKVTICLDALDRCSADSSASVQATFYKTKESRKVFKLESSLTVRDNLRLSAIATNAAGQRVATADVWFRSTSQSNDEDTDLAADRIKLERLSFQIPQGWKVHQDAAASGMLIIGLTNGRDYMRIYVQQGSRPDMNRTFVNNNARITRQPHEVQYGAATWTVMETAKDQRKVAAFATEKDGFTYWGFASSAAEGPAAGVQALLESSRQ